MQLCHQDEKSVHEKDVQYVDTIPYHIIAGYSVLEKLGIWDGWVAAALLCSLLLLLLGCFLPQNTQRSDTIIIK